MAGAVAYYGALAVLFGSSVDAFAPAALPSSVRGLGLGSASGQRGSSRPASSQLAMSASERGTDGAMDSRRRVLALAPGGLLFGLGLAASPPAANALSVPSAVQYENTEGSIKLDGYLQHAVIECRDLDDEVDFWTKGMGMRVLRTRTIGGKQTKFVGYGPETLKSSVGGHFALEITEAEGKFDIGTGFQRFNFELPTSTDLILRLEDAGGSLIPRWFGTSNFIEAASPSGYTIRINPVKQSKVAYPFKGVTLRTDEIAETLVFFESLGMTKQDDGPFSFLGDGSKVLRYSDEAGQGAGPSLVIEPLPKDAPKVRLGNAFKLALISADVGKTAAVAKAEGDAKVLFEGKAPGTETKVSLLQEPSTGYAVAIVDYSGFEKEMPKAPSAPPPPAPKKASAAATPAAPEKKKRPRFGEKPAAPAPAPEAASPASASP